MRNRLGIIGTNPSLTGGRVPHPETGRDSSTYLLWQDGTLWTIFPKYSRSAISYGFKGSLTRPFTTAIKSRPKKKGHIYAVLSPHDGVDCPKCELVSIPQKQGP